MTILTVEWLKLKRSPVKWVVFVLPFLLSCSLVWYFHMRGGIGQQDKAVYQVFFEVWSAIILPIGAGLLPALMIQQEEMAGGFLGLLGSKATRSQWYVGKFLILALLSTISTTIAIVTLLIGCKLVLELAMPIPIIIAAAILVQLCTLPLLAFHLWISFAWGMGPTIGIGAGGLLLAALMATSLGDKIWAYVPWGWAVRLSMLPVYYLSASSNFGTEAMRGFISATLFFLFMGAGGILWFNKWEGRKV